MTSPPSVSAASTSDSSPDPSSLIAESVPILGASGVSQTLLVAREDDGSSSHTAPILRRRLFAWGQLVAMASPESWRPALDGDDPPEVVLIDAASESLFAEARELCRALAPRCEEVGAVLVVALPPALADAASTWDSWQEVGAQALLDIESPSAMARSWFELWARYARLRREHGVLRETLGRQVQRDELTGGLNRRYFFQAAHREVARSRRYGHPLSCLMVDINYFNLFNKTFGYACGDHILRSVAHILRSWTRESDIVSRFGAKKFAILLPETDVEAAMLLHEKLQREVDEAVFEWAERRLPVTISIGEAERLASPPEAIAGDWSAGEWNDEDAPPSVREELADLLEDADAALYVAKKGVRLPNFSLPSDFDNSGILGRE